jgi:hypothetical protein
MISKINYLLLGTMMVAAIDSTFGKCCPCWKDEENGTINNVDDLNPVKTDNVTTTNGKINSVDNLHHETTENTTATKKKKKKKKKNNIKIDINAIVSDTNSLTKDERTKIINLFDLLLKNNVICDKCVQNTAAENKIVLVYDVSKKEGGNGYNIKTISLNFGYCEQHTTNAKCDKCNGLTKNLAWCGHKLCENCLAKYTKSKTSFFRSCKKCNVICCSCYYTDHFFTHCWCNDKKDGHFICFDNNDEENPYAKNNGIYNDKTWRCHEHKKK